MALAAKLMWNVGSGATLRAVDRYKHDLQQYPITLNASAARMTAMPSPPFMATEVPRRLALSGQITLAATSDIATFYATNSHADHQRQGSPAPAGLGPSEKPALPSAMITARSRPLRRAHQRLRRQHYDQPRHVYLAKTGGAIAFREM